MTFSQLHYTSCKNGLSGYSGFQFCAATPDIPREVMREVERHTIYELPSTVRETEAGSPEDFPVNLLYIHGEISGVTLIARVQFTGLDFSNRSGNYFAHALITSGRDDLQSFLPVELWGAPFWQSQQGATTELPPIVGPPPTGPITRQLIAGFLASQTGSREQAAALLTAADQAIGEGRQLLLIGPDTESVCRWIATASYLLEPGMARQMTFSTYSYDPRRCRTHVVGTISEARPLRADFAASFNVFDLAEGILPDLLPSPSAALLARLGVALAPDLWRLAESLGALPGQPLNNSFPALASAALILGHQLTADEFGTAIEWLSTEDGVASGDQILAAANGALEQPLMEIPAHRQEQLIEIALRADSLRGETEGAMTSRIESGLVKSSLHQVDLGKPPGEGVRLRTRAARKAASDGISRRLSQADANTVVELLTWASAVGAEPALDVVRRVGRDVIVSWLLDNRADSRLTEVAKKWPELRAGVLAGLASLPASRQRVLLSGPAGKMFQLEDFSAYQALGLDWLMTMVADRSMRKTVALSHIVELRGARVDTPLVDENLIKNLWHGVRWTPKEAIELLDLLPPAELAGDAVASRFGKLLRDVPVHQDPMSWMAFVSKLADRRSRILRGDDLELAAELARLVALIKDALRLVPPDEPIDELVGLYDAGSPSARVLLDRYLPPLLVRHSRLALPLMLCPPQLFERFCAYTADALANKRLTTAQIAGIFVAMLAMKSRHPRYSAELEEWVLVPGLATWKRDDINALGVEADLIARNSSSRLKFWYRKARRKRFRLPRLRWMR